MRKDIPIHEVTEVGLALVPEKHPEHGEIWAAHLVNLKDDPLRNVIVNVEGREVGDNTRRTATMRYHIPEILPLSAHPIEVILPEVMAVNNQFWISFSHQNYLYDKKIIVPHDAGTMMPRVGLPVLHCNGLWFS